MHEAPKYWYGWIPTLTSELFFDLASACFRSGVIKAVKNQRSLNKKKLFYIYSKEADNHYLNFRSIFEGLMHLGEGQALYYHCQEMNPGLKKELIWIAVVMEKHSFIVKKVSFFKYPSPELLATCEVHCIEKNGLVKFSVTSNDHEHDYAKILFGIIRDVYHEHVYSENADAHLMPVRAKNNSEAIEMIYKQYQQKILWYHSNLSRRLNEVAENGFGFVTLRLLHQFSSIVATAKGEMIFGLSFVQKVGLSDSFKESIKNAYDSLNVLSSNADELFKVRTLITSSLIKLVATIACAYALHNYGLGLLRKYIDVGFVNTNKDLCLIGLPLIAIFISFFIITGLSHFSTWMQTKSSD